MKRLSLTVLLLLLCLAPARALTPEEKKATVAYLQQLQQGDGGFLASAPNPLAGSRVLPNLRATTSAVRALHHLGSEPKDRDACVRYVESAYQKDSGGFLGVQPALKPDVNSTAIGLMAVTALKLPAEKYSKAVDYLGENARDFEEVRLAAAGLEAVGKRSPRAEAWLKDLAKMRNADGTYGEGDGAARATGSAVVTVLRLGGEVEQRDNVVKTLKAGQRKDGGYGAAGAKRSDLESTYRVLRAFVMLKEKPDVAECQAFVAQCRNADGGYGVAPGQGSSVAGTYFATTILHWLEE